MPAAPDQDEGVEHDRILIEESLALSPDERLDRLKAWVTFVLSAQQSAPAPRD